MPMHRRPSIAGLPGAASIALSLLAALSCASTQAGIALAGTRIVFAGAQSETFISLHNRGELAGLAQLWLDGPEPQAADGPAAAPAKAFFVLTPSLFRVEPGQAQRVRIHYTGAPLPADRESLFWLNVQEIPPKAQPTPPAAQPPGRLHVATRTRVKLMYRPPGLPGSADLAPAQLRWSLQAGPDGTPVLQAANPTAYVVNLGSVDLKAGDATFEAGSGHVLPGQATLFSVQGTPGRTLAGGKVVFGSLNDWGAATRHEAQLPP